MLRYLSCFLLALATAASAKPPRLVKDINRTVHQVSPSITWAEPLGQRAVFALTSPKAGREMWVAGDSGPARLLKDIDPGPAGAMDIALNAPVSDGKTLYFEANDGRHGRELWRSDGTPRGTRMVIDLNPGPEDSGASPVYASQGRVFFQAWQQNGVTLWCNRGKPDTTEALNPPRHDGTRLFDYFSGTFTTLGKDTYFLSEDDRLWKSDGTAPGTSLVETLPLEEGYDVEVIHAANGILYLTATNGESAQTWISQGTPGSARRLQAASDYDGIRNRPFTNLGKQVFVLMGYDGGGENLWVTDGTEAGSRILPLIDGDETYRLLGTNLTAYQGAIYFEAANKVSNRKLWRSDGTAEGTFPVEDLGADPYASIPVELKVAGKWLYYSTMEPSSEYSLWRTDGRPGTATRVKVASTGIPEYFNPLMAAAGDSLFFGAGWDTPEEGLWRTQGAPRTTMRITDLEKVSGDAFPLLHPWPGRSLPLMPVEKNGGVVFAPEDGAEGVELWFSDGSKKQTRPIWSRSDRNAWVYPMGSCRGEALFASSSLGGYELWITDGRAAGTRLLKSFEGGEGPAFSQVSLGQVSYFLTHRDGLYRLWQTDGTEAGTLELSSAPTYFWAGFSPSNLVHVDGKLFFIADSGPNQNTLWRAPADGQGELEGVKDITGPGTFPGDPLSIQPLAIGGRLDFFVQHGTGWDLWTSDGTAEGTAIVSGGPGQITLSKEVGGLHVFIAWSGDEEKWYRSDGTAAGTFAYADAGGWEPEVGHSAVAGGELFYLKWTQTGLDLWRTDGSQAGTQRVKQQVLDGFELVGSETIAAANGRVYFAGESRKQGVELWQSDGSPAGTRMVRDLLPGVNSSNPSGFTLSGGRLFFQAAAKGVGRELHTMELPK